MKRLASVLALSCASLGAQAEPSKGDLQRLQGVIQRTQQELQGHRAERGDAEQRLREAELAIAQLEAEVVGVRGRIAGQRQQLQALQRQRDALLVARQAQEAGLAEQLRLAYQLGRQPDVRLLMRQEEPARVNRAMYYLERLNQERLSVLAGYRQTLDELARVEPAIRQEAAALEGSERQLQQRSAALAQKQAERQQVLAELDQRIKLKDAELQKLKADQMQLEKLLAAIAERQRLAAERAAREAREREEAERKAAEAAAREGKLPAAEDRKRSQQVASDFSGVAAGKSFTAARGRLPWPVAGSLANYFGDARAGGALRWQGVTIRAAAGAPVRSVHAGVVVFADAFSGAGLLMVVDHGGGYMTLYAHNQSLARKVGDNVAAGDVLAAVGGGQAGPGVYFEIRYNGEPQDPQAWCVGRR